MSGKVLIDGGGGGTGSSLASSRAQKGDDLHHISRDEQRLKALTEAPKSSTGATSIVDLGSFPKAGVNSMRAILRAPSR